MMLFRTFLLLSLLIAGCSSSEPEQTQAEYPNLISLNPPENQQAASSKVYIDSVKMIDYNQEKALLISGNLANGCTYLREASHVATTDSLSLSLKAWKPAEKMCSQALVPFSFIYNKISQQELESNASAVVNKKSFKIQE